MPRVGYSRQKGAQRVGVAILGVADLRSGACTWFAVDEAALLIGGTHHADMDSPSVAGGAERFRVRSFRGFALNPKPPCAYSPYSSPKWARTIIRHPGASNRYPDH